MLARLAFGLVLGLLVYLPRPVPSRFEMPSALPPVPPPGHDGPWPPLDAELDVPPTPPPGFEGAWPPHDPATPVVPSTPPGISLIRELLLRRSLGG